MGERSVKGINMDKNEEKIVENLKDIELLEKEFRKTKYGKFMMVATILFIVLFVIGMGIAVFEAIVNFRNLDMNAYQPIIDLGELCRHHGGSGAFYAAIFYTCILPVLRKDEKEYKKNNNHIATLWLVAFAIIVLGYTLGFIIDVVPIAGRILAM